MYLHVIPFCYEAIQVSHRECLHKWIEKNTGKKDRMSPHGLFICCYSTKSMCWLIYTTLCHKDMIKSIYELALIRKRVRESKQVLKFARQGKCPADKATRRDINMSRETKNHQKKISFQLQRICAHQWEQNLQTPLLFEYTRKKKI